MSQQFYASLHAREGYADALERDAYEPLPSDWCVVVTDIEGSTQAIEAGRYKDVNALGAASIVAVRNAVPELAFPFVFGGDGASMALPQSVMPRVLPALRGVRIAARDGFALSLRVGVVPVSDIEAAGAAVRVAKLQASPDASFALFAGGGLLEAEDRVKGSATAGRYEVDEEGPAHADFSGFECRWNPLPSRRGTIVSLLIQSRLSANAQPEHYQALAQDLFRILGGTATRPVDPSTLTLATKRSSFHTEAKLRGQGSPARTWLMRMQATALTAVGRLLLRVNASAFGFPSGYKEQVTQNSDYQKFDDMIRMVLDLSPSEVEALEAFLREAHEKGSIAYGIHQAASATMTCIIGSYDRDHIHFVDGADGGYAAASVGLKSQLRRFKSGQK